MSKLIVAVFGVRVTVLYSNGAKMRMRAREFALDIKGGEIDKVVWKRPMLSWSREPVFLNVDQVTAVWQGRA